MNVFDLLERYAALDAQLQYAEDLPQDERANVLAHALAELHTLDDAIDTKLENIAFLIKNREALIKAREQAADKMRVSCGVLMQQVERLKELELLLLQKTDRRMVQTPNFAIRWQFNPGRVQVNEESKIPPEYWRTIPAEPQLDSAKLLSDLKQGVVIEGVELVRDPRIVIT
jgi:hypothetical protein